MPSGRAAICRSSSILAGRPRRRLISQTGWKASNRNWRALDPRGSHALLGNARRHGGGPYLPEANRVRLSSDRGRGVIPAGRCLSGAAGHSSHAPIREALGPLEYLRAVKTPKELGCLRIASERVVNSMLAVFRAYGPGTTKRELVAALRREDQARGLTFAPGDQPTGGLAAATRTRACSSGESF